MHGTYADFQLLPNNYLFVAASPGMPVAVSMLAAAAARGMFSFLLVLTAMGCGHWLQ